MHNAGAGCEARCSGDADTGQSTDPHVTAPSRHEERSHEHCAERSCRLSAFRTASARMAQDDPNDVAGTTEQKKADPETVSWFRLFNCDAFDYVAILLGLAGSLANAPIMPLFAVVFGDVRSAAPMYAIIIARQRSAILRVPCPSSAVCSPRSPGEQLVTRAISKQRALWSVRHRSVCLQSYVQETWLASKLEYAFSSTRC